MYFLQEQSQTVKTVLTMLETILPTLTENYQKVSPMGSTKRAQKALHDLHNLPKTTENTENLMVRQHKLNNVNRHIF